MLIIEDVVTLTRMKPKICTYVVYHVVKGLRRTPSSSSHALTVSSMSLQHDVRCSLSKTEL